MVGLLVMDEVAGCGWHLAAGSNRLHGSRPRATDR